MKKREKLIVFLFVLCIAASATTRIYANAYTLGWDLVDSGKHLDVDGNSSYMSYIWNAKTTWNNYKAGVIRKDSITVIQDVYVSDVSKNNGVAGTTYNDGKIKMNTYVLKNCSSDEKKNVAIHEIGHALGLAHNKNSANWGTKHIMYENMSANTKLSGDDKESYDAAYKKY